MSIGSIGDHTYPDRALRHLRIGDILRQQGDASQLAITQALAAQKLTRARFGDILKAHCLASPAAIAAAAAQQQGLLFVDLAAHPVDQGLLRQSDAATYIRHQVLPWRKVGGATTFIAAEPDAGAAALKSIGRRGDRLALAEQGAVRSAVISATAAPLAGRARLRRPLMFSLRRGVVAWQRRAALLSLTTLALGAVLAPLWTVAAGTYLIAAIIGLNGLLWLLAVLFGARSRPTPPTPAATDRIADHRPPPCITLLIALYDEAATAPLLIDALRSLDYPPELLDVKLVLEADDKVTGPALLSCGLPPFAEILVTPPGGPRTKPRALNFAMEFARGDIIGVYDAEDRPDPNQLRQIVAQFESASPDVACIQARLGYYNTSENFISRCFEIEYAAWFDVMLPGLRRLGLPIPLGGTSFFIRRGALAAADGWDSFNVTEDADLGVMLARAGLRTELSRSLTEEEANCRPGAWIKQRSRWLKGYMATWITHMAHPVGLWRDLGAWRFLGLNTLLLSAVFGYLALPVMWIGAITLWVLGDRGGLAPDIVTAFQFLGDVTILCIPPLYAAASLGLIRRGRRRMTPMVLCLPFYWPLGAVAAYLAVYELIVSPTSWRKTTHGVGRIAKRMRAQTLTAARNGRD